MDIKDFRIVEDAIRGFYIQVYKKKYEMSYVKRRWSVLSKEIGKVENPDWYDFYHPTLPLNDRGHCSNVFKTKQEAIDYLEKLCTPLKFYYPTEFRETSND